jgi:hypothetical protein
MLVSREIDLAFGRTSSPDSTARPCQRARDLGQARRASRAAMSPRVRTVARRRARGLLLPSRARARAALGLRSAVQLLPWRLRPRRRSGRSPAQPEAARLLRRGLAAVGLGRSAPTHDPGRRRGGSAEPGDAFASRPERRSAHPADRLHPLGRRHRAAAGIAVGLLTIDRDERGACGRREPHGSPA